MKKYFSLIAVLLASSFGMAMAQDVATDSTAVASEPGAVTETPAAAAEEDDYSFLFEKAEDDFNEGVEKRWEYHLDLVFNTTSGTSSITSDESAGFNVGVGYNLTKGIYAGVAIGYLHDFGGTSGLSAGDFMPLLGEVQFRWNFSRKLSAYIQGRAGMLAAMSPGKKDVYDINKNKADFDYPNYLYYEVQPGLMFRVSQHLDIRLSVGYAYAYPYKESKGFEDRTYDETVLHGKFGFGYRF